MNIKNIADCILQSMLFDYYLEIVYWRNEIDNDRINIPFCKDELKRCKIAQNKITNELVKRGIFFKKHRNKNKRTK